MQRRRVQAVVGLDMSRVEAGDGPPIVLLHGDPTDSCLGRNVIPHLEESAGCIAPDLNGTGRSAELPDRDAGSSRLLEHRRFLPEDDPDGVRRALAEEFRRRPDRVIGRVPSGRAGESAHEVGAPQPASGRAARC